MEKRKIDMKLFWGGIIGAAIFVIITGITFVMTSPPAFLQPIFFVPGSNFHIIKSLMGECYNVCLIFPLVGSLILSCIEGFLVGVGVVWLKRKIKK